MKEFALLLSCFLFLNSSAQQKPIGSWTDHLPYRVGTSLSTDGSRLYVGTNTGMFTYNMSDQSLTRYSKVNLLNDVDIAMLKFNPHNNTLVIVYANANIDLIKGSQVINLPFIKESTSINNKVILDISFENEKALLSFGFGIVELNTDRNEISDSYKFGPNGEEIKVNSSVIYNNFIYAASDEGLYRANRNSNLLDFNSWNVVPFRSLSTFKKLIKFNNKLYAIKSSPNSTLDSLFDIGNLTFVQNTKTEPFKAVYTTANEMVLMTENSVNYYDINFNLSQSYNRDSRSVRDIVLTSDQSLYVVNNYVPLEVYREGNLISSIKPNGPYDKATTSISIQDGVLWTTNGGFDAAYNSTFQFAHLNRLENGVWTSYLQDFTPNLTGAFDVMSATFNPNKKEEVYFGSFGTAMYRIDENLNFTRIDDSNSSLQKRQDVVLDWTGVPDAAFDEAGNLWVTNAYTPNCLSSRIGGNWTRYNMSPLITPSTAVTELIIAPNGYKWIAEPRSNRILVFDDRGTPTNTSDDRKILLSSEVGQGSIPGIAGITMELDQKNQIWLGTSDGIAVFFNPDEVFEQGKRDAKRILIEGSENVEVLLAGTTIKDIAIDGANRKWIATDGAGVYLLSEDGLETIHHFTEENSPLFSNSVGAVAIDNKSGEVYFGTQNGIISYRGTATEGEENFSKVKVFPNPVRESYTGPIAISGLMDNSTVKITDISGNLVNELRSIGGQAIWDGKTFRGERAATGVYLIFNSAENDKEVLKTHIGKILLVN